MQFINKLKQLFKNKDSNLIRNLFLLGMLGVLLIFAGNIFTVTDTKEEVKRNNMQVNKTVNENNSYLSQLSGDLEETLSLIKGVGAVKVQLLIDEGISYKYEYNQNKTNKITNETDKNGGQREIKEDTLDNQLVVIEDASGNEKPVVRVEKKPAIKGAIVVARGAEISEIKYDIYKTVSKFLDLPLYKISVLPYERR